MGNMGDAEGRPLAAPLEQQVQFVKGVGPERAKLLEKLGVATVADLLYLLPRDYQDLRNVRPMRGMVAGELQSVQGRLQFARQRETKTGRPLVEAAFADMTGYLTVTWFNRPTAADHLRLDQEYCITGKPTLDQGRWRMSNPKVEPADGEATAEGNKTLLPVYPLTEGLHPDALRAAVREALRRSDAAEEILPESLRGARGLPTIAEALQGVHYPRDLATATRCRNRLAYDELLTLQVALAIQRAGRRQRPGYVMKVTEEIDERIRRLFPFRLTDAQDEAIAQIRADLASGKPMYRLLQGDVGCGKTAVAIYAMLVAIAHGYQAALMAPTSVLAKQHFAALNEYLAKSRVRRLLLTGSLPEEERAEAIARLAAGEVDLVVGTHALTQKDVSYSKLGLVIIDEQHKFGVRQRAEFLRQGHAPHQLVMTATPLPRSLSMTWFGDLDVSIVAAKPPGRKETLTYVVGNEDREKAYEFLEKRARAGALGLVVCPRIEGDADDSLQSVNRLREEMVAGRFADLSISSIHGKMPEIEREEALRGFRRGDIRVLISTVVIEVGIDLPNATVLVIENAERFGLSQLHQMRGRVGRGDDRGICFLIDGSGEKTVRERLYALASSTDGFQIAELDAQSRGVGEPIGVRQSGFVRLGAADVLRDVGLLHWARDDARRIVAADPALSGPEWRTLRHRVLERYGQLLQLALVG